MYNRLFIKITNIVDETATVFLRWAIIESDMIKHYSNCLLINTKTNTIILNLPEEKYFFKKFIFNELIALKPTSLLYNKAVKRVFFLLEVEKLLDEKSFSLSIIQDIKEKRDKV